MSINDTWTICGLCGNSWPGRQDHRCPPPKPLPFAVQPLTKREYFAGLALNGQLAFSPHDSFNKAHQPGDVAIVCVKMADALIAELERYTLERSSDKAAEA